MLVWELPMLSINAVKGFEYGLGFVGSSWRGSEQNDTFLPGYTTATNTVAAYKVAFPMDKTLFSV